MCIIERINSENALCFLNITRQTGRPREREREKSKRQSKILDEKNKIVRWRNGILLIFERIDTMTAREREDGKYIMELEERANDD